MASLLGLLIHETSESLDGIAFDCQNDGIPGLDQPRTKYLYNRGVRWTFNYNYITRINNRSILPIIMNDNDAAASAPT